MSIDWARDEVILAADLASRHDWKGLPATDLAVIELSRLLRAAPLHPEAERDEKFRNPNGVARKTWDIATIHPDYVGKSTRGGRTDKEVLAEFLAGTDRMRRVAASIRSAITSGVVNPSEVAQGFDDEGMPEGRILQAVHARRERNPKLRAQKLLAVKQAGGEIACEVCGFNFGEVYGDVGDGYIEVHHVRPLHDSGPTITRLVDLALLCSNCHRMIHRARPWLTPAGLRGRIHHAPTVSDSVP